MSRLISSTGAVAGRRVRSARPGLERLETRLTPYFGATTYMWTALGDQTTWNDPLNWSHVDPISFSPVAGSPAPGSNVIFPSAAFLPQGSPTAINFNFSDTNMPLASLTIEDSYTFSGNSIQVDGPLSVPDSYTASGGAPTATFLLSGVTFGPGASVDTAAGATVQLADPTDPAGLVLTLGGEIDKNGPGRLIIDTQTIQYANSASVQPIRFALLGGTTELAASTSITGIGFQTSPGASLQIGDNAVVSVGPITGTGTIQLLGAPTAGDATALSVFTSAAVVDVYNGPILGQGRFATTGFGTLTVNSIDFGGVGTVVAQSGTLNVDGPISAGGLQIGTLGTLGGLGAWSITGPVVFQAGSTWNVAIDGTTPGTGFTQLSVSSAQGVTLGGARLTASIGYQYEVGDQLPIIAAPLVTGSFANVAAGMVLLGSSVPFAVSSAGGVTLSPLVSVTTTTLASDLNPLYPGLPVTITAVAASRTRSVSGGMVNFYQNGSLAATVPVVNGRGSYTTSFATVGTAVFVAVYTGSGTNLASTSGVLSLAIVPFATTTVIASAADPASLGAPVELVAQVATFAGPVTGGSVVFRRGSQVLGVAPLNGGGFASLTATGLPIGLIRVQAIYQGGGNDLGSVSSVLTQRILPAMTTTTLVLARFTTPKGLARYELSAQVASAPGLTPLGLATFKNHGRVIGRARLKNGRAVFVFGPRAIPRGVYAAFYPGGPRFQASGSGTVQDAVREGRVAAGRRAWQTQA